MAEKLLMLALSPTMETGIIAKWTKNEGDAFKSGDVLCEIETDKATMEYEASNDGVILKILLREGQDASVGEAIAITGKAGEDISALLAETLSTASGSGKKTSAGTENNQVSTTASEMPTGAATGSANPAEVKPMNAAPALASQAAAIDTASGSALIHRSSPLARKIAQNAGISIDAIPGSGPGGRVIKRDVEKALSAPLPANVSGKPPKAPAVASAEDEILPVSGKRRVIAQRLSESMYSAPHYYLKLKVAMDGILQARKQYASAAGEKISVNTYLIKFTAEALKKHPAINSTWNDTTILRHSRIDIGLAVAQKDGLITPVVRDCGSKGLIQIEHELKELILKAQSETLKPEEYTGATFTISNLGSFGIEEFTAIINPPGSAILAVGEIIKEQVVNADDSVSVKSNMKLTLSCDHRVIDGAVGAAFLSELKGMLQDPIRVLY